MFVAVPNSRAELVLAQVFPHVLYGVQFRTIGWQWQQDDGKGRFLDNIFIERTWRSLKYEEVFTYAYGLVAEAPLGINAWKKFYNDERKHQALGY